MSLGLKGDPIHKGANEDHEASGTILLRRSGQGTQLGDAGAPVGRRVMNTERP